MKASAVPVARVLLTAIGLSIASGAVRADAAWLDLPLPPRTQGEWVLQQAQVNGLPTRVMQLDSELRAEELLQYYQRTLARYGSPKPGQQGIWQTLVVQQDPLQIALQVQPAKRGGSRALLSQMNMRERHTDFVPKELPRLPQTRVTQVTESVDGARRSRLVQMVSDDSFEQTQQRLRAHWAAKGWRKDFDQPGKPQQGARNWLASFSKNEQSLDIVLAQNPGDRRSYITVNLLDTQP